jgi:hypothetical protein
MKGLVLHVLFNNKTIELEIHHLDYEVVACLFSQSPSNKVTWHFQPILRRGSEPAALWFNRVP